MKERVVIGKALAQELVQLCLDALPAKCYGLVGGKDLLHPATLYRCWTNRRNEPEWRPIFESFGDFYKDPDRGFVIEPEEYQAIMREMAARGESLVGVFHSHRCRPAEPTELDMALAFDRDILSYIVSVVFPRTPELKVFRYYQGRYEEIPVHADEPDDVAAGRLAAVRPGPRPT